MAELSSTSGAGVDPASWSPAVRHPATRVPALLLAALSIGLLLRREPELPAAVVTLLVLARGRALRRPLTVRHLWWAAGCLLLGMLGAIVGHPFPAGLALIVAAIVVCLPTPPPAATPTERSRAVELLASSSGDALAPFVLPTDKAMVFSPSGGAVLCYRVRFGIAVAGGDPVGRPEEAPAAIAEFFRVAEANGWRPAVLGAAPASAKLWRAHGLRGGPIGRDVVIDVGSFTLPGRRFRNLRQAVHRASNAGMTVQVVAEQDLPTAARAELTALVRASTKNTGRGFAMILDGLLDGSQRHTVLTIGRGPDGKVVAFQRYGVAGGGTDLALDVPWRRPDTGIGICGMDERTVAETVGWAALHGGQRVSPAFAAFPDLFDDHQGLRGRVAYRPVRSLDGLIRLESLYRFLRKFSAFGNPRSVLFRPLALVPVLAALLTLEFSGS